MATLKTQETDASVPEFLDAIPDARRQSETRDIAAMMERVTGHPPRVWGDSILGFGRYRYQNTVGKDLSWFLTGVAPRKKALTVHIMSGFEPFADLLAKLGRHKTSVSCLYLTRLDHADPAVLETLIRDSVALMRARHPD